VSKADAKPTIWLLSAYHADSHADWADWLSRRFDHYDWQLLSLPGRRVRGNSPTGWRNRNFVHC